MITVFLGAGFSAVAGVPLTSQLFDTHPYADSLLRADLIRRVQDRWERWNAKYGGTPEEYLAHLDQHYPVDVREAIWYVALVVTLSMPKVRPISGRGKIGAHSIGLTSGIAVHDEFWTQIFRKTREVSVITTNYDVLAEREIRLGPRLRIPRPGFHYGNGPEDLRGRPDGIYRVRTMRACGTVPIYKLHGSISWTIRGSTLYRFHDCRPAVRGDAALIAPTTRKHVPEAFRSLWNCAGLALRNSCTWIVVGYSFPDYDRAVNELLQSNSSHNPRVHIFNPDSDVVGRARTLLRGIEVSEHGGLPDALPDIGLAIGTV